MLLVDRVAHLPRVGVALFDWSTAALLAGDRVADFVGDLLTVRPSNCLAVLLCHLVALLLGHVHAVLLWHCIAVLGGHPLALLLRHIVTLLLGQVVADWSGHKLALLPWDILALLLCHLVASLVCHFLALRHRVRLANTPRHFVATWSWVSCFPVTSFLPMPVTSLISRFSVSFSLGFPPPPEVASEPAIEASVGRQTSCSCRVNSVLSWRILVSRRRNWREIMVLIIVQKCKMEI